MKELIAISPILLGAIQYEVGDALPENADLAEKWVQNGVAVWKEDAEPKKAPKAIRAAAEPGQIGISTTGNPDELAGKIPKDPIRDRDVPRKRKAKK